MAAVNYYVNDECRKRDLYTDFVCEMRWSQENYPYIRYPSEYQGQKQVLLTCTQHDSYYLHEGKKYSPQKITQWWVDYFREQHLAIREAQFCTITTQKVFDAFCQQESVESLRFKYLRLKEIAAIRNMKNLKRLFIEEAPSVTDLSPLAELDQLEILILGNTKAVYDYSPVGKLKNLKVLCVADCSVWGQGSLDMESDSFLEELTNLEYLEMSDVRVHHRTFLMPEKVRDIEYAAFRL